MRHSGAVLFYGGLAAALLIAVTAGGEPGGLLGQVVRNGEACLFALLTAFDLEVIGADRSAPRRRRALWWSALAAIYLVLGPMAGVLGLPGPIATLAESPLAALVLSVYLHWSRPSVAPEHPLPRRQAAFYVIAVGIPLAGELLVGSNPESPVGPWIVETAEVWGFLILAGVWLDVVRPWPFDVREPAARMVRLAWYAALITVPVLGAILNPHGVDRASAVGIFELGLVWLQRVTEAFVAVFLLSAYAELVSRAVRRETGAVRNRLVR